LSLSGRCGRGHIVVGFITTNVVGSNPAQARCTYISLFLNKPLQYIGIKNSKTIYKYIHAELQLERNRNEHRD